MYTRWPTCRPTSPASATNWWTPAALDPAQRAGGFAGSAVLYERPGCELPRGARFRLAACEGSWSLNRPAAWPTYS